MTIKKLIQWGVRQLIGLNSAQLDAELIMAHVLKKDRTYVFSHDDQKLGFLKKWAYKKLILKRKKRIPLAYLTGEKEFYGLSFKVNKHTLIPRPDTEILVQSVLSYIKPGDTLLDVGTGSGCIPISILKNQEDINAVGLDVSIKALEVASENAKKHQVESRLKFIRSDILKSLPLELFDQTDLILTANLPYVPLSQQVNEEAAHEPSLALYAENNGLDLYQKLIDQLGSIEPKAIFFECYEFQAAILASHLPDYELKLSENMLGEARMLMFERIQSNS